MNTAILKNRIDEFLKQESSAGIILLTAALLAVFANNSWFSPLYQNFLQTMIVIEVGALSLSKPMLLWINDGLMAVFFFLVGLEIKRELLEGELSSVDKASLPLIAALGGMVVPALIFLAVTSGNPDIMRGWAIPAATDIAFALGILALLGRAVPISLKIFLLAVAIIDDLGAITIIALFYTEQLALMPLGLAGLGVAALIGLNRTGVQKFLPYALIGAFVWVCFLKSGVHATIAGVLVAMTIPLVSKNAEEDALLHKLEHNLHPWTAFLIIPLFAFANAGVSFAGLTWSSVLAPLPLGIAFGLFFGKQIGVFGLSWAAVKLGLCRLPQGMTWAHLYGVACLTGIGFTMSLFIGNLAFASEELLNSVRVGVLLGSLASGLTGFLILRNLVRSSEPRRREDRDSANATSSSLKTQTQTS